MREGLSQSLRIKRRLGITPAYAGRTQTFPRHIDQTRDHPRLCGKDAHALLLNRLIRGSPPLMREGHALLETAYNNFGITPAYAGRTTTEKKTNLNIGDHPRLCGKDLLRLKTMVIPRGSPPLMREGLSCCIFTGSLFGITPAYAGRTVINPR